jgi:hypothetical protein
MNGNPQGKKTTGLKCRWDDNIKKDLKNKV